MQLEREMDGTEVASGGVGEAALDAVLAQVPKAALVCDDGGGIVRTNAAAESLLAGDPGAWSRAIAELIEGGASSQRATVAKLSVQGDRPHFLVIIDSEHERVRSAVETAREAWGLTPREAQVLSWVAEGLMNREIAEQIGCARRTVELHVTSLLRKVAAGSRAQLIIALWKLSQP